MVGLVVEEDEAAGRDGVVEAEWRVVVRWLPSGQAVKSLALQIAWLDYAC